MSEASPMNTTVMIIIMFGAAFVLALATAIAFSKPARRDRGEITPPPGGRREEDGDGE